MKILENKTAIITGAGSGMGKAMAILFAKEGANVIVADLKTERVDSVVNEIISAGGKSTGVTVNVSNEEDVKKCVTLL